ncbi:MAG: site-2 protease family protein, partial [Planctomycetota bacterium]
MVAPGQLETLRAVHVGLRNDLHFTRQDVRGETRYVVHDPLTFKNHVFSFPEYRIMTALAPATSLEENFAKLVSAQVLQEEDHERFYSFVVQLHHAHLLKLPIASADILFQRFQARAAAKRKRFLSNLLYAKVPLLNPDRYLDRTKVWFSWLFSRVGFAIWATLMLIVCWACAGRVGEVVPDVSRLLEVASLPVIWVLFVVLKVFHEFGHAYACKRFGGEVPEMGIAFIVMTPCAYVDAGASWKFHSRWERVVVGIGGMWIESFVAGIAALVWAGTLPGVVHDIALQVVLLASVTTFLGNANPLLRFDGYYVLSDLLGVVNLSKRSAERLKSFAKHVFLGMAVPRSRYSRRERQIYLLYGPAAFAYRLFLAFAITSLMLMYWPGPGLVVGAAFFWLLIVDPIRRLLLYMLRAEETEPVRRRAWIVASSALAVGAVLFLFCPVSLTVVAPGVLEPG